MNAKNSFIAFFTIISVLVTSFYSCRKSDRDTAINVKTSKEYLIAEVMFNDIFKQIHNVAIADSLTGNKSITNITTCASGFSVESTFGDFPKMLTLDFGSENILCDDGRKRRGKIIATFNKQYPEALSYVTITTCDYYIEDFKLDGKKTIKVEGIDETGIITYTSEDNNAIISKNDLFHINWASSKLLKWTEGTNNTNSSDDVFTILVNEFSGTATKGNSFSGRILEEITLASSCNWPISGMVEVVPNNLSPRTVDFGNTCNSSVEISYLGNSKTVEAH